MNSIEQLKGLVEKWNEWNLNPPSADTPFNAYNMASGNCADELSALIPQLELELYKCWRCPSCGYSPIAQPSPPESVTECLCGHSNVSCPVHGKQAASPPEPEFQQGGPISSGTIEAQIAAAEQPSEFTGPWRAIEAGAARSRIPGTDELSACLLELKRAFELHQKLCGGAAPQKIETP